MFLSTTVMTFKQRNTNGYRNNAWICKYNDHASVCVCEGRARETESLKKHWGCVILAYGSGESLSSQWKKG